MFRYARFYILPVYMALLALGLLMGGIWLWLPALGFIAGIALLDQVFDHDLDEQPYAHNWLLDLALYASTPCTIAVFIALFWQAGAAGTDPLGLGHWMQSWSGVDVIARRDLTPWYHPALMLVIMAIPITGVGGLAGHELTHRTWRPFDLWLGRFTMAWNWGIAFPIEHVYGHHAYVGTNRDPATAARGDSLYAHLPKAMWRTIRNAWAIELQRLDKRELPLWSYKNNILRMALVASAVSALAYAMAGWKGLAFHLSVCVLTKVVLEALNYVEHYGLLRLPDEPVQPRHSWNCNHAVSGVFTYNLTRHSHHHADAQVAYQDLRALPQQPQMPGGFMTAYLSVWWPALWRRRIAPRLLEWDRQFASARERVLAQQANAASGWEELAAQPGPAVSAPA